MVLKFKIKFTYIIFLFYFLFVFVFSVHAQESFQLPPTCPVNGTYTDANGLMHSPQTEFGANAAAGYTPEMIERINNSSPAVQAEIRESLRENCGMEQAPNVSSPVVTPSLIFTPEVGFPGFSGPITVDGYLFGKFIFALFRYLIYASGIMAVIFVSISGFKWVAAGGNQSKISDAKNQMINSMTGMFLVLATFLILSTINEDLVIMKEIKLKEIDPVELRNQNILEMSRSLEPGEYCGCFNVQELTYARSGFTAQKTCSLIPSSSPYYANCQLVNTLCRNFGIDPVYAIAQWKIESSMGTQGVAAAHNNPGNFRCSDGQIGKENVSTYGNYSARFTCVNGWRHYRTSGEGLIGYFVSKKINNYLTGSIRSNIYRYAPPSDGNQTNMYISNIVKMINLHSDNKHPLDKNLGTCPCS